MLYLQRFSVSQRWDHGRGLAVVKRSRELRRPAYSEKTLLLVSPVLVNSLPKASNADSIRLRITRRARGVAADAQSLLAESGLFSLSSSQSRQSAPAPGSDPWSGSEAINETD